MDTPLKPRRARRPMPGLRQHRRTAPGAAPGTLVADPEALTPHIRITAYGPDKVSEQGEARPSDIAALRDAWPVVWIDVVGLGDAEAVRALGEQFGLHALALEDVLNVHQRPKAEDFGDHLFVVTRMPAGGGDGPETEQVALFVGEGYVLSFQERQGDCFEPVRQRLRREASQARRGGADYLAYALVDAAIDSFFPVLERYGETVERLEDAVVADPQESHAAEIHALKRDLLTLRRAVWPQREMINQLLRDESPVLADSTKVFLRDCYDHTIQLLDMVETYREIASGLTDIYLSSMSNRLNEAMQVLTVIATIFIPLSFIASLYGMNFDTASPWNMPELGWRFGYPAVLLIMAAAAVGLLWWFRRRGWLGRRRR